MTTVTQINTKGISCHCFGSFTCSSCNTFRYLCVCLVSLPDPGSDRHAGGAGDFLWAAAPEAAEEDVLREEGEATGPPCHFGAWPSVLYYSIQESCSPQWGQNPSVCQCHNSGLSQWWPHDRLNVTHTHWKTTMWKCGVLWTRLWNRLIISLNFRNSENFKF